MSRALQLEDMAKGLLKHGLARMEGHICLAERLTGFSLQADKPTLIAIARLLFQASPPSWLRFVVRDGHVAREYMPTEDLENLAWIEPELDQMLLDTYGIVSARDDLFLKAMGDAAELFVLAALARKGANPLHVSKLSDSYGYDIECSGATANRIEVKAASHVSQSKFHITRNEFEKSSHYGREWRLLQVVFANAAFVSEFLNSSHIAIVRELRYGILQDLVPVDTPAFKWTESALITTRPEVWGSAAIELDPDFRIAGFGPITANFPASQHDDVSIR
jgi:hypothetical protein